MANKDKLKKRLEREQRIGDELFAQVQTLQLQLTEIDTLLTSVEFPGPTIEAYVAQTQQFLQLLCERRGLTKKSSTASPSDLPTEAFTSGLVSSTTSPSGPPEDELLAMTNSRS